MSSYYMPTKIIMGSDCIDRESKIFREMGNKALVVTGRRSAKLNGAHDAVIAALVKEGIDYDVYDEVMPNPTVSCVLEGAKRARGTDADFIVAIGGGSPMDAAKAIAMAVGSNLNEHNIFNREYITALPLVAVPTTAGTGSEVTPYAILTNDEQETKTSLSSPMIFPKYAFLDEQYMMGLSVENTINTTIDALSHAVEGMISIKHSPISDAMAEKSIAMILSVYPAMQKAKDTNSLDSLTKDVRQTMLYASAYAGMVIAQTGTTSVHAMGYSLTYYHHVDHGRANGLLLGPFMKFVEKTEPGRIQAILEAMSLPSCDAFIDRTMALLGETEQITETELMAYSEKASKAGHIHNSKFEPTRDDLKAVFEGTLKIQ